MTFLPSDDSEGRNVRSTEGPKPPPQYWHLPRLDPDRRDGIRMDRIEMSYSGLSTRSDIHSTKSESSRRGVAGSGSALTGAQPTRISICG
jgi:hypothetical protein